MNYKRITVETFAKVSAIICAILLITILCMTFSASTFDKISGLKKELISLKDELTAQKEIVTEVQATLDEAEPKLQALEKEKAEKENALTKANADLDKVCSRSYYSSYSCDKEANCKNLHAKVSSASTELDKTTSNVNDCLDIIESAKADLETANDNIENLNRKIKEVSSEKTKAVFTAIFLVLAMLITFAGIIALAKFLLNRENKLFGFIACGALAVSSLFYVFIPKSLSVISYLLSIIIFAIFYVLIAEKTEKRIPFRVIAVILSIAVFIFTFPFAPITALLYSLLLVLVSFVLVPCIFTEYLDIAKHIFFNIISFGIWQLIWIYNVTENLNKVEAAEKRAPVRELLLCIFLPLYLVFWTYKTASITEMYGAEKGIQFKIDVLCLAFAFVSPLVPSIIIQDKINTIVGKSE